MEAMQTFNPADVWDMVQKAIVWLAGIGIVIDLTPGIKIQPVRWLIKQLGNLMNHDLKEQLNQLENDFIEHKVDSWRTEILSFQSSCINHERHTKEEFDHVIDTLAKYDKYIKDHKLTNPNVISVGQKIKIPGSGVRTYTVKSGDSLWAIAAKQLGDGSRYNEIKTMNGLTSNTIYAGQTLKLPA